MHAQMYPKATWDRSSLTFVVMVTSPSAFGGGGLTGLAIKIEGG